MKKFFLFLFFTLVIFGLNADPSGDGIEMIYTMGGDTSILMVYSTSTGEFQAFYLQNKEWHLNPYMPQPEITISKGDIRMITAMSNNDTRLLMVYSASTGEYQCFYLKDREWLLNPYMPQPEITITKENLRMMYAQGNGGTSFLMVYSEATGEFQTFYLKDRQWLLNPYMPQPPITIGN